MQVGILFFWKVDIINYSEILKKMEKTQNVSALQKPFLTAFTSDYMRVRCVPLKGSVNSKLFVFNKCRRCLQLDISYVFHSKIRRWPFGLLESNLLLLVFLRQVDQRSLLGQLCTVRLLTRNVQHLRTCRGWWCLITLFSNRLH